MTLALRRVSKDFVGPGGVVHRAVSDLSLDVPDGTFCTLLGPSGCGKTTLLRLVAGFEQPTAGQILHRGRVINDVPPYRRAFPMVFQSYALFPHMTVLENVVYGLRVRGDSRADMEAAGERALALLGIGEQRSKYPAQLSGGQQQRVALARCLVLQPEIILFDEPLSNLDAELRISMRREIRALQRRLGITAVYVTHDQEEALAVSDVVVVLNEGRIEQVGAPRDVYERPASAFVARFMGAPNIAPVEHVRPGQVRVLGMEWHHDSAAVAPSLAVIRSDAVVLGTEEATHAGVIEDRTYLGTRTQYLVRLDDGTRLTVDSPAGGAADLEVGDRAGLKLLPDRVHFVS